MRTLIFILTIITLTSCFKNKVVDKKSDRLFSLNSCKPDTLFLDKPNFDTAHLTEIISFDFTDYASQRFFGHVSKLTNEPAPVDGGAVYYLTPDLGIIYSKSTAWSCYKRLHSTNDSIEKRINQYIDHILSKSELITAGEIPPPVIESATFISPTIDE